jgi:hypothetical protein
MPSAPDVPVSLDLEMMTTGTASSPADLIDLEELLFPPPPNIPVRWAFRGQSQSFGTLVPSFQRVFKAKRSAGAAEIIELDLIKTFRMHYATLKGRTADMPEPPVIGLGNDLRCLSVMQHYGVPSRLLDWTSNFWTAVYFACAGDPAKEAELWMYDRDIFMEQAAHPELQRLLTPSTPGAFNPPEPDLLSRRNSDLIVELDPRITPRMKEQEAHHTLSTNVFADHRPLLTNLAAKVEKQGAPPHRFRRMLIASGCKEKALRFLEDQKKVTAGTIFPDVEGLGKFLHWHLESLLTTLM